MNIVLAMVVSADGRITKGNNPNIYEWTSEEDQRFFSALIKKNNLIIIGSKTYDAAKQKIHLQRGKLRVVLTRNPDRYIFDKIPGQFEFSDETPRKLITRLEKIGYTNCLLASGGTIASLFLQTGLVNEIYLTVEPKLLGFGKTVVADREIDISLTLKDIERLNKQGTILLRYKVNK